MIGSVLLGTVTLSPSCRPGVIFLSGAKRRIILASMAAFVSQPTPGISQFGSLQDCPRVGDNPLGSHFEVLVRFSLDVQSVCASKFREFFGPVATPMWNLPANAGSLRRYLFPLFIYA